jgi:AcrR family transcriptional regulator
MDGPTDGRRVRGDATRRVAARRAAEIATVNGLDSISVGQLALETGLSKSGILTVFGSRENIQIAAVAEARKAFRDAIFTPAWDLEPGRERLRAVLTNWRNYLSAEVFPGGCFLAAAAVEYGHRDGPVAESVQRFKQEWLDVLESELAAAGHANPAEGAFQIDAYVTAANTRHQLFGDVEALDRGLALALAVVDQA